MPYDEQLAENIRTILGVDPALSERKMFGGICFMVNGNMICGVTRDELIVRVRPDRYEEALASPGARPMEMTGRPARGMALVGPGGYAGKQKLRGWVEEMLEYARSLPPKKAKSR